MCEQVKDSPERCGPDRHALAVPISCQLRLRRSRRWRLPPMKSANPQEKLAANLCECAQSLPNVSPRRPSLRGPASGSQRRSLLSRPRAVSRDSNAGRKGSSAPHPRRPRGRAPKTLVAIAGGQCCGCAPLASACRSWSNKARASREEPRTPRSGCAARRTFATSGSGHSPPQRR